MPISTLHGLDKISIGSSFTLDAITSASATTEIQSLMRRPASHIANMGRANLSERPRLTITTPQIDVVLAAVPVNGLATSVDSYMYQKLKTETGSVARATTSHTRFGMSVVLVYWTRITLPHQGEGTIEVVVIPIWDGSNAPIVPAGSVALAGNLADSPRYGAGPVEINGSLYDGIQNIEISSGCVVDERGASSEVWTTHAKVREVDPMARVTSTEIGMTTYGASGTVLDGSNGMVLVGRRIGSADGSSHHILMTGLNGAAIVESESAQGTEDFECVVRGEFVSASDAVMPLIAQTAQAIA